MNFYNKSILIVTNIPTPYKVVFFNELFKKLNSLKIQLKVVFANLSYPRRKWEINLDDFLFEYTILGSTPIQLGKIESVLFCYNKFISLLKKDNPDIVIVNGFSVAATKTFFYSLFTKKPYLIWSESIRHHNKQFKFIRSLQRKIIARRSAGCIVSGIKSKEYFLSLGVKPEKIFTSILTTDTKYFSVETEKIKSTQKKDERYHLLSIGNLTAGKRFDRLLRIVSILKKTCNDFVLNIIGDGLEKNNMMNLIEELNLKDHVELVGYVQKEKLPKYFAQADCFLFPSAYDVWGMVLVEAMAAGIPCISSVHSGATHDLIIDGENGFAMDFSNEDEVAEKINWILNNPEQARRIGDKAKTFIKENATIEKSVNDFVSAVRILSQSKNND